MSKNIISSQLLYGSNNYTVHETLRKKYLAKGKDVCLVYSLVTTYNGHVNLLISVFLIKVF